MYCPQCGQLQVSETVRFCPRCGFLLDGVSAVVASGGSLPARSLQSTIQKPSPRSKGVRQGAMLMLSTILVVPVVAILGYNLLYPISHIIIPLSPIVCFVGGLLRILYALLLEDPNPDTGNNEISGYGQPAAPQFERTVRPTALPPAAVNTSANWRPRPNTAEIYQPPSVTENTTRLLDKDEPKNR